VSALPVGVALAQIGEFSFILVDLGVKLNVVPPTARDLILGASLLSIVVNPALFYAVRAWRRRLEAARDHDREVPEPDVIAPSALSDHAVVVGYGRVGRLIADQLAAAGVAVLIIEESGDARDKLTAASVEAIVGNAVEDAVLDAAALERARIIFVAIPQAFEAGQIVQQARKRNARIRIIARAHFDAEVDHLYQLGANVVVMGEREIARTMLAEAPWAHETEAAETPLQQAETQAGEP
jgi:CPA2 family monovalent cation:H+ antiporter-2